MVRRYKRKSKIKYSRYAQINEDNIVQQVVYVPYESSLASKGIFIKLDKVDEINIGDKIKVVGDKVTKVTIPKEQKSWWKF